MQRDKPETVAQFLKRLLGMPPAKVPQARFGASLAMHKRRKKP